MGLEAVQEKLGRPLYDRNGRFTLSLADIMKDPTFKKDEALLSTVTGTKVLDTILAGAEYAKGDQAVWREASNYFEMTDATERMPRDTPMDYTAVKHGVGQVVENEAAPTFTTFDVTDGSKTHRISPKIDKNAVKDSAWNQIENMQRQAGEALGDHCNYDFILGFDAADTIVWATDVWVTFTNGLAQAKGHGFFPNTLTVGPAGERLLLQNTNFIDANRLDRDGHIVKTGQIGRILYVDVFYCRHVDALPTEGAKAIWGVLSEKQKAVGFGLRDPLNIQEVDDPDRWLTGAVAEMRFDVQLINALAAVQLQVA